MRSRDWKRDYRLATSPFRVVPDFIIAGEAKCGTTSLYRYLTQHPDVRAADRKEPNNFITDPDSLATCRAHYPLRWSRWFRRCTTGRTLLTGEASAEYFSRRGVAERIARMLPRVKIVVLLRDPVRRALSDYRMLEKAGLIRTPFAALVQRSIAWLSDPELLSVLEDAGQYEHSEIRVVLRGLYLENLRRWADAFPGERLRVVFSEELFADAQGVCDRLFEYLGLAPFHLMATPVFREGDHDLEQNADALRSLVRFYSPYNERLYAFLGRRGTWTTP